MTNSKFKKQFMTVTPFSKRIALLMVISLPFIGFYFGYNFPRTFSLNPTKQEEDLPPITQSEPESVTQDFYSLYVNCINFQAKNGKPCEWKNSSYVDKALADNLVRKKINLTCSVNIPAGVVSKLVSADPNQATVDVYQVYEDSVVKVRVALKNDNDAWKIDDIFCQ